MHILVIFTGGTIGSEDSGDYISPDTSDKYKLIKYYKNAHPQKAESIEFTTISPYFCLSENLSGKHLNTLSKCLSKELNKDYDGIIITHGTDTLQYSAAVMGFILNESNYPVVFVSSNYVLEAERANGPDNFYHALEFISQTHKHGVFIAYKNSDGINYIHDALQTIAHQSYSDDLFSVQNKYYGSFINEIFEVNKNYKELEIPLNLTPNLTSLNSFTDSSDSTNKISNNHRIFSEDSNVLRIYPYPGIKYPKDVSDYSCVLLDYYHSGTIATDSLELDSFLSLLKEQNIPCYLAGGIPGHEYASLYPLRDKNVFILPVMSPITAYIFLWLKYSPPC